MWNIENEEKKVWYLLIWMYDHPNILILHMVKNLNRLYTIFIHNEKTIPCISKSKTYHVENMKGDNESFPLLGKGDYDWPTKVHYYPLVLFQGDFSLGKSYPFRHFGPNLLSHWFFFKEIFPWRKVIHSDTLGLIFWAIGGKLSIPALWARSFKPLVLFQGDFSLGKSCPFWHYFGPHLLNHWFFFKEILPLGKSCPFQHYFGPIFWAALICKIQK